MEETKQVVPYGVFLKLVGLQCVMIGGGRVAERKASALLSSGANITVISPALTVNLEAWKAAGRLHHIARHYIYGDVQKLYDDGQMARLVFAATDQRDVNQQVYEECREIGTWVNVIDNPELCTFFVPATVTRGDLTLAISTNGANPAFAKALRQHVGELFGNEFAEFLDMMRQVRADLREKIKQSDRRTAFYQNLLQSDILESLARGDRSRAWEILATKMKEWEESEEASSRNPSKYTCLDADELGL